MMSSPKDLKYQPPDGTVPGCMDGIKDNSETDVDCGGGTCGPCNVGLACQVPSDCTSLQCLNNVCTPYPFIQFVSPNTGPTTGNIQVTIRGEYFDTNGAQVTIGGVAATVQSATATALVVTVPAGTQPGMVNVTVTNSNGLSATSVGGFAYVGSPAGAACIANNQCVSSICGTTGTGHCCTQTCSSTVPACAASDCNTNGTCAYPGNSTAPGSLQNPGTCQQVVCNGTGGSTSIDDAINLPTSNSACLINPSCCGPSPLTPCFTDAATGTPCTSSSDPTAHVCGNTANGNIAGTCVECNSDADCLDVSDAGVLSCNTSTGTCM